ncbi:hypothetical protein Tsubulata_016643 [Turnera subulata]|uniref:UBC core domain-containing protein n=1 Tax=Turnera subulata TaxID=218843 RepID=A0A9Q0JA14_9ROSI|nr:hypothetical protein Tsubulata_016643 [Turnera subulata]
MVSSLVGRGTKSSLPSLGKHGSSNAGSFVFERGDSNGKSTTSISKYSSDSVSSINLTSNQVQAIHAVDQIQIKKEQSVSTKVDKIQIKKEQSESIKVDKIQIKKEQRESIKGLETGMDLLRAVIVGADGTPYHNGLCFFDILFPAECPSLSIIIFGVFHSTHTCPAVEKYALAFLEPELVIRMRIDFLESQLPYFNEPLVAYLINTAMGKTQSMNFSENTFFFSLKTMVYTMRRPPKMMKTKYKENVDFHQHHSESPPQADPMKAFVDEEA